VKGQQGGEEIALLINAAERLVALKDQATGVIVFDGLGQFIPTEGGRSRARRERVAATPVATAAWSSRGVAPSCRPTRR